MSGRTLVVIFFFWAVLTIVTPTLILLSESSRPDLDTRDNSPVQITTKNGELRARRMMVYSEKIQRVREVVSAPVAAPVPSPEPEPVAGNGTEAVILTRIPENNQTRGLKSGLIS